MKKQNDNHLKQTEKTCSNNMETTSNNWKQFKKEPCKYLKKSVLNVSDYYKAASKQLNLLQKFQVEVMTMYIKVKVNL